MEILKVIFLSFVEGFTEFLPISSTGHLIIVNKYIELSKNTQFVNTFMIIIQLGAILSVIIYFREKLFNFKVWLKVIIAVIPAGILGVLFDNYIEAKLFFPKVVAFALVFYGIILFLTEIYLKNKKFKYKKLEDIPYKTAIIIGICQCLALVPGTSRSASTIIGGLLAGVSRVAASEFSFFLAIPTMLGASFLKIIKMSSDFVSQEIYLIALGFVFSFIFAYIFISIFMKYIKKYDFKIFAYYRIIIGIIVLLLR